MEKQKITFSHAPEGLLKPIFEDIKNWSLLISDLDFLFNSEILPVNFDHDYFILSPEQFQQLVTADPQIIWGVVLGFSHEQLIEVDEENLPYAEGSEVIWKNGNIQHPKALIEIVCFDSGYTIVKFRDAQLSDKFKAYFDEALDLEDFSNGIPRGY